MPGTRGRPRKYSGPLQKGRTSIKGLNKKETTQVENKIKKAIKAEHTLKYFNSNQLDDAVHPEVSTISNKKQVSVIGFSSTTEFDSAGAGVKYGPQDLYPLYLSRPFKSSSAAPNDKQILSAQYCLPKLARGMFSIERVAYAVAHAQGGTANPTPNMARSLPISYRIIKIGFKAQQGTQEVVDPNLDLFLDSFGQPTGIDQDDFDRLDMRYSKINTKKYVSYMDIQGTISQNNIITPSDFAGQLTDTVTQKNGSSLKHLVVPFKLSARKNGKLFYEDADAAGTKTMTSGGQRQLLLCHFYYDNAHTLVGNTGQPNAPDDNDLQIKVKSMSAFVDTQ